MLKHMMTKILEKGGEEKMKMLKTLIALTFVLGLVYPCFASQTTGAITVSATIPTLTQALNVTITPVNPTGDVWDSSSVGNMSGFGGLTPDTTNKIWKAGRYYAVDVGVSDNSGTSWYLTHAIASIKKGTDTLDNNVNVVMDKVVKNADGTESQTLIQKKVFAESAVTSTTLLNKAALAGGWLRIYYGIATGNTSTDATNAAPILFEKPAGTYSGSVTITLSP